ncbi:MAG TPA: transglutaminase-like domain-containing protein [Flavobacteriales bacterium]|nr:transglutaminase-like domain-containing protein [Flavobacteriales bacterium]
MSENEIRALIALIDDPDEGIYDQVRELEQAWELDGQGDLFRNRVEDLLHTIHLDITFNRLTAWRKAGADDLLEGALAVCRYRYAELDEQRVRARLAALRQDIWLELNDNLTAFEKVRVFNHIFYQVHGFKGNKRNYHAPQNSYINEVLETHKGNPLSLAIIYQVLAEDLDLPLRGVNLPNHFVLAYMDETGVAASELGHAGVLFYVNAFSQGDILGKAEIDEFLGKLEIPADESFYQPCTNLDIIRRLLNNLLNSYEKLNDPDRVEDLKYLLSAL